MRKQAFLTIFALWILSSQLVAQTTVIDPDDTCTIGVLGDYN